MSSSAVPFNFLFLSVIIFGTLFSISSSSWFNAWFGLEINILGFIPLLIYNNNVNSASSAIIYFIIQSVGSGIFLLGNLISSAPSSSWDSTSFALLQLGGSAGLTLIVLSLLLKIGGFPFYFWLPQVTAGLSWFPFTVLITWQNITPLFLLSEVYWTWVSFYPADSWALSYLVVLIGLGSLVGGVGGIGQTNIRLIMTYSSINHISWITLSFLLGPNTLLLYFSFYFTLSIITLYFLSNTHTSYHNDINLLNPQSSRTLYTVILLMLLSFIGMPPILGFYPNLVALIGWLAMYNAPLLIAPLVLGSLISLYYYLALLFSCTFLFAYHSTRSSAPLNLTSFSPHNWSPFSLLILFNLAGAPLIALAPAWS